MLCARCRSWNFRDYRFCRECGEKLNPTATPADPNADPRVEELLHHAFTALDQGELDAALNKVQEALAIQPGSAPAHSALGSIYERRGMLPEAIQQTEMALQLSPDCTADREKLERLRRQILAPPRTLSNSRTQIAAATAAIAATLVFGIGAAVLMRPQPAPQNGNPTIVATGATNTPAPRQASPANNAGQAWGVTPPGAAAKPGAAPAPNTLTATPVTTPPVPGVASSSAPAPGSVWGAPPITSNPAASASTTGTPFSQHAPEPLTPAVVGQVQPLPTTPEESAPAPTAAQTPAQGAAPTVAAAEPSEPETGFIQIEAGANTKPGAVAPGAAVSSTSNPAISPRQPKMEISFGRGGGGTTISTGIPSGVSPLSGAKQLERQAFAAYRRGDSSEATRLFRQAERQYGGIAERGGNAAGQATEGLETSRQMLERLRR